MKLPKWYDVYINGGSYWLAKNELKEFKLKEFNPEDLLYTGLTWFDHATKTRTDEYELVFYKNKPHKLLKNSSFGYGG